MGSDAAASSTCCTLAECLWSTGRPEGKVWFLDGMESDIRFLGIYYYPRIESDIRKGIYRPLKEVTYQAANPQELSCLSQDGLGLYDRSITTAPV